MVPKLKTNLLSINQLTKDNDCIFKFSFNGFIIKDCSSKNIATRHKNGKLYIGEEHQALNAIEAFSETWHQGIGHPNYKFLRIL